ncbi:MAG: cell division protein FtsQ/DivIB [Parachlamydiaceae bacterium]
MSGSRLLPFRTALFWIVTSAVLSLCLVGGGWFYWGYFKEARALDPHYNILAIVQSCMTSEPLQTNHLAELLDLSVDYPTNLYQFNTRKAETRLLQCPLIKSVQVEKIKPSMIYIEYALRKPVAYLPEFTNTAIDDEGVVIPTTPFFTPKKAYELVLGLSMPLEWGSQIPDKKLRLVRALRSKLETFAIKRIDVSNVFSAKYGEREIVLFLEEAEGSAKFISVLRLSPKNWEKQLVNYQKLRSQLMKIAGDSSLQKIPHYIIDLRLPQIAFIAKAT